MLRHFVQTARDIERRSQAEQGLCLVKIVKTTESVWSADIKSRHFG
jgi:hypothetical protein